jgi:hypothetical protein
LTPQPDKADRRRVLVAFVLLLAIVSAPLFSTVLPPLVDYPNHLARLQLIAAGGNGFYAVRWAPLPDLAADIVVPALAQAMPLEMAGKLFLAMSFALLAGGTLWLNRIATGRWLMWPLLAFALLYNRSFLWGFINYLFGLGLALCGIALWLALEERRRLRAFASVAVALACFFAHLAAFGVYVLAIAGVELSPVIALMRGRRYRDAAGRVAAASAQFVLPAIILLGFAPASPGAPISYGAFWRKADLLFSVFDNYSRPFDVVCFALLVGLLVALSWQRRLAIAPRLGMALIILFAVYLVLPAQILSGSGADHRLPVALFLLLIAATNPSLPRRPALVIGIVAAVIFGVRMAAIEAAWLKSDGIYAGDIAAIDNLPEGVKLAVAFPPSEINAGGIPQLHIATLAAARRGVFVPTIFAGPTQHPLMLRPPYDQLAAAASADALWVAFIDDDNAARVQVASVLREYDFIVFVDRGAFTVPALSCLRPMPSPLNFQLFSLGRDVACF